MWGIKGNTETAATIDQEIESKIVRIQKTGEGEWGILVADYKYLKN